MLSPLSSTTRGVPRVRVFAKIQNSKHRFSKLRFHIFLNRVKITKIAMTFGQPTYQPWPKVWNFFESSSSTPHPRFNDEGKTQGGFTCAHHCAHHITDPGVWGVVKIGKSQFEKSFKLLARVDRFWGKVSKHFWKSSRSSDWNWKFASRIFLISKKWF